MCLLDLSTAFDTIDHSTLLTRLSSWFGIHGSVLNWFKSYLSSRSSRVRCNNTFSSFYTSSCGVPQDSVLGPLLFIMYTNPLSTLISLLSLNHHLYADDTQLFFSFYPTNFDSSITHLQNALQQISSWMTANLLTLNSSKTEFLLIGFKKNNLTRYTTPHLTPLTLLATLASSLTNILLFLTKFQTSPKLAITILDSSVVSVLTLIPPQHAPYYNLPKSQITRLQLIQNSLARAVVKAPKSCHITPVLRSLHWLKITECIEYKLLSLTYKVLTTTQPPYLHHLISVQPPRSTHSSSLVTLARPPTSSSLRITDRSFHYASPCLWNQLPSSLRQPHLSPLSLSCLFMLLPHLLTLSTHHSHHP